jgi:hypothetical protein
MQYASHAYRADGAQVPGRDVARIRFLGGALALAAALVALGASLGGFRQEAPPGERPPAVELRPVPTPSLSVMSIDLLMAAPGEPVPITLGEYSALGLLEVQPLTATQVNVARFIAQNYRVPLAQTEDYVRYAYMVAEEFELDPLLLLAVMAVESSFNPRARSAKGAKGLMQVLARVHSDKFEPYGGVEKAYDPLVNIRVGARILRDYIARDGSVRAALKSYVGAALLSHDFGYGRKVLRFHEKLAAAAAPADLALREPTPPPGRSAPVRRPGKAPVVEASATDGPRPIQPPESGLSVNHGRDAAAADPAPASAAPGPVKL